MLFISSVHADQPYCQTMVILQSFGLHSDIVYLIMTSRGHLNYDCVLSGTKLEAAWYCFRTTKPHRKEVRVDGWVNNVRNLDIADCCVFTTNSEYCFLLTLTSITP